MIGYGVIKKPASLHWVSIGVLGETRIAKHIFTAVIFIPFDAVK
jgi:hypothetical protein